jgi:hypothetical protein
MLATLTKYGALAAIGGGAVIFGSVMHHKEMSRVTDMFALDPMQETVMQFCVKDLNVTGLTYGLEISDAQACGCIASKIAVSAEFGPTLQQGIENYETYEGNMEVTGQELARHMIRWLDGGDSPQTLRRRALEFGNAYEGAENACLSG